MNGWTLLYKTVERDIETKSDVLIAVVHWQLLRVGMKCIGIGDDVPHTLHWLMIISVSSNRLIFLVRQKTLSPSDEESELLPDGWNINKTSYSLRYKYQNEVFILLGMVVDDSILMNLLVWILFNSIPYPVKRDIKILEWKIIGSGECCIRFGAYRRFDQRSTEYSSTGNWADH